MTRFLRLLVGGTCRRCAADITSWRSDGFCSRGCRSLFEQDVLHP